MAEEKDNDSAPDEGLTESGSATPENDVQNELDGLDALDEREDEFDSDGDAGDSDEGDSDEGDSDEGDSDRELVSVGAASAAAGAAGAAAATGGGRKGRATPKQRTSDEKARRSGPIGFVRGSVSELQKVVYPTWPQLANYFVVVLIFVLIIIAIVSGLDYGFGWLMLKAFT